MENKTELQRVSEETMRFMRGKYKLDEVPGKYYDIDCLKFRQGKRTILSINIHEDRYDFQIIYGKVEREKFEARRKEFPKMIQDLYDKAHTYHDGKWMLITVKDLKTLEVVKKMILLKKNPNRKPFPKENAIYASCGHRCDLCVHYSGASFSEEFRAELKQRIIRVYANGVGDGGYWGDDMKFCDGCHTGGIDKDYGCEALKCAKEYGFDKCHDCYKNPCDKSTAGWKPKIEMKHILAEDVTWAILPYVYEQYGN
ncbi:MAG: DUF3788 family protein [Oscillospiraceae bacterium]|jgi:hypothetical protein|nr:DUF3788 family protein [Oscillospiraceae bacterium]